MKKSKLLMTILLSMVMLLTACQTASNSSSATSNPASTASSTASSAASSEAVTEGPAVLEGNHDLRVEIFERGVAGQLPADKSFHTMWILEEFKKDYPNINLSYHPVPRAQELDMLNILMATGEAPDICILYNEPILMNYVMQGGVADLTEALDKYGPNLKGYLKDSLPFGVIDGKQYALTAKRVNLQSQTAYIRSDWLATLGLPVPSTTQEFYETMVAFKEKDPGGLGAETIPYVINADPNEATWTVQWLVDSFTEPMSEEDFYCLRELLYPGVKEGLRLVNKMYNEGLLNADFALDNDKQSMRQLISRGVVGAFQNNTNFPLGNNADALLTNIQANVPGGDLIPMDPFVNSEGVTRKRMYSPTGVYIFVPSFSKSVDAAVTYLDWLSKPETLKYLQNGIEGHHWELRDGIPYQLQVPDDDPRRMSATNLDVTLTTNGQDLSWTLGGDPALNPKLFASTFQDPHHRELYELEYEIGIKNGYMRPRFDRPIDSELSLSSVLKQFEVQIFVNVVSAPEANFDAVWDKMIAEYLVMGAQEVMDAKREAFKEMKG